MQTRLMSLVFGVSLLAMGSAPAFAEAPRMKITTDVPPEMTIPDEVETRLGTLKFFDRYSDKATTEKLYCILDHSRAVIAYLNSVPAGSAQSSVI